MVIEADVAAIEEPFSLGQDPKTSLRLWVHDWSQVRVLQLVEMVSRGQTFRCYCLKEIPETISWCLRQLSAL